jgi:hypothetical protein
VDEITINRAQYLFWLRENFPELYFQATLPLMRAAKARGLSGFFDTLVGGFKSVVASVATALPSLAKTYAEYDVQKRLIAANTQRASQGLPPVQYDAAGQLVVAGGMPYTQADLAMAQQLQNSGVTGNDMLYWILGFGLVAVLLLKR